MIKRFFILFFLPSICFSQTTSKPIWHNKQFALYADSIVQQNKFVGKAISATELETNYKSPANEFLSPALSFKFSINGKDNEMKPGIDHHFNCSGDNGCETPLIQFGKQFVDDRPVRDNTYLKPQTPFKVKLDMREVLNAFNTQGYYTTFKGEKIYKQDFNGVYIAGNTLPMTWDFDNLHNREELKLKDDDNDGIYETTLILNDPKEQKQTASSWKQTKVTTAFPQYYSSYPISNAVYNMALEEMIKAVEPDSTFRTGKEWAGVWTRDISYSIILSMAYLQPRVAKYSLLRKVNKRKRIIQDTGTGGAWPCSTDRMIWATAAWELYKATGDEDWLKQAYEIIQNSLGDDYKVAYDDATGLVRGESSFLDWREQTYPKWMQPVDIYQSECLGTNAVHYQAYKVLSKMAKQLGYKEEVEVYNNRAQRIKQGINKYLWMPLKGYYGQYLYGRNTKILSPRSEALGEALCVWFGIADADKQKQIIRNVPVIDFGIPCIYPEIPGIPPYHNNAVWPFVQSYWALAAAKAGNEEAVMESIAAIYRPAALWVTNKENFVATNGDFAGTVINSSNMLWSLSGSIALVHKILFGIEFTEDGLLFHPFVPMALQGKRSLTNFTYRNAILDIEMSGYGNSIKSCTLDGKPSAPKISENLKGHHKIKIVLFDKRNQSAIHSADYVVTVATPIINYNSRVLSWDAINGAVQYKLLKNGKEISKTNQTKFTIADESFGEYQVIAVDAKGYESFASEPILVATKNKKTTYEIESIASKSSQPYKGFSGEGFVEISDEKNTRLTIPVTIQEDGLYTIDFRYANGNGPINTENKCAIRSLNVDDKFSGTVVLPQRGTGEWSNWGWSNPVHTTLSKGYHALTLGFEPFTMNMNGEINQAMLDYMRIIKIK